MLRTSPPVRRRKPVRASREPKEAVLNRRERERRFVPAEAGEWHARQCAQDRAQKALRKHGVLIRLRLVPRADASNADIRRAVEALRREDFIVWHDENALQLTGEPALAVTFMDMAANAGILSPSLRCRLGEILKSARWLRAENRAEILQSIPPILPLFSSIETPN